MEPHILKNRSQAQNSHAKTNQWCSEAKSPALCWRSKVRRVWAPLQPLQASQIFSLNRKVAMSSVTVGASKQNEHVSSKSERVSSILTPWSIPYLFSYSDVYLPTTQDSSRFHIFGSDARRSLFPCFSMLSAMGFDKFTSFHFQLHLLTRSFQASTKLSSSLSSPLESVSLSSKYWG